MSTLLRLLDEKVLELIDTGRPADIPAPQDERTFSLEGDKDLPAMSVRRVHTVPVFNPGEAHQIKHLEPILQLATTYAVDCYGRGAVDVRPTQSADGLASWVWRSCVGRTQSTGDDPRLFYQIQLGAVVNVPAQSDHPYGYTRVELVVFHQTRADDPEAWE